MKLITMALTVMSLVACKIDREPEASKAKFTPEKTEIEDYGYGLLWEPRSDPNDVLVYLMTKVVARYGFPPQLFVIRMIRGRGTVVEVHVRAVDNKLMPLSQPNDCIDKFVASDVNDRVHSDGWFKRDVRSIEIKKGRKSVRIKFNEKEITGDTMITEFEYTTVDTRGKPVTYEYKKPRNFRPDIQDLGYDHPELTEGADCDR